MSVTAPNWDGSWNATSIANSTINNGATATTAAISHDGKSGTEVSVELTYGATATEGVKVYVLRDIDGTDYEAVADGPWSFEMPKTASGTHRRAFFVDGHEISSFKVHLVNNAGANVTNASVRYKQHTEDTA